MPYIPQERRKTVDPAIEELAQCLAVSPVSDLPGLVNYTITSLITKLIDRIAGRRYSTVAMVSGVLENVKQEFYRRYAAPYEDEQVVKNGDVEGYK